MIGQALKEVVVQPAGEVEAAVRNVASWRSVKLRGVEVQMEEFVVAAVR
jgi:hypothetical protein